MTLDPALLENARREAARHAEAERHVQEVRGDYYGAVRTLHLAGAPLREIADALGLSHQRVQQMVQTAGGSWWARLRGRRAPAVAICTFCNRPPAAVSKLVAGPAVYICDACIARAAQVIGGGDDPLGILGREMNPRTHCSFCRIRRSKTTAMVNGPARICADCLQLCRQIVGERAG